MKMTTKSIYALNKGESVVLSVDDKEYKDLEELKHGTYLEIIFDHSFSGCDRALVTKL